eukprot:CAMPEP_0182805210 /NCGR_PEP_ID=MMETSP0006_2-20121128/4954_1 /TAXON_ID=97485 /ORGANISM="Prymnesium parvum, Strain Texoma1" /LENGTH=64 /DNA_ID=CAMNT_0024930763 /DNA_START=75 /DNA_END=269 /DNA_ORIENTATION=-
MSADSNMATPVLGSTRYGAVERPASSFSFALRGEPFATDMRVYGTSSSTSISRTSLQNWFPSYE